MTRLGLLLRTLRFHWRTNLAVMAGCAVGAAVLTGALLVGDSMRGSLRNLTMLRLGRIDSVVVGSHFFSDSLAGRIVQQGVSPVDPLLSISNIIAVGGSATNSKGQVAPRVNIIGTTPGFWTMWPRPNSSPQDLAGKVVINRGLVEKLQLGPGDTINVSLQKQTAIPSEGLLGERDSEKVLRQIPFVIDETVPDEFGGRFSLESSQNVPLNLFVPIEQLAEAVDQPGRSNALLVGSNADRMFANTAEVIQALPLAMTLEDYGLTVIAEGGMLRVESQKKILDDRLLKPITTAALQQGATVQSVLAYLANTISANGKEVPYSIVAAVAHATMPPLGPLPLESPDTLLANGTILLNRWTADQLAAKPGDEVTMRYFVVDESGAEKEVTHSFSLAGTVKMEGLALDRHFTPDYPGITDADTFGDWDPPFPFDSKRVREDDEKYWDDYRTAPKAFVTFQDGRKLWSTRYGSVTSVRVAPPLGVAFDKFEQEFRNSLLLLLQPSQVDMTLRPVKQAALRASEGSTPFGVLFVSFSFFLIASSVLLVGLLFRLNTERRASQIGLMLAIGLGVRQVRMQLLGEGIVLALIGSAIGLTGSFWYAQQMIDALNTDWQAAVSTPFLEFHWTITSLWLGYGCSVFAALPSIWWGTGRLGKIAVPRLLHRGFTYASEGKSDSSPWSWIIAGIGIVGGFALVGFAFTIQGDAVAAFFIGAILLLTGTLALMSALLRRPGGTLTGRSAIALTWLGVRNGGRYPARSVLTAGLLAFATFVVVAVGAMRHGEQELLPDKDSGNGGFSLVAQTTIPLRLHLQGADAAFELNLSQETEQLLENAAIQYLRVREGEDASCLNVYKPEKPTLLGVNDAFIDRGGFVFAASSAEQEPESRNPWTLLKKPAEDRVIPCIGDMATLQWILQKKLGDEITVTADDGEDVRLKIVGSLAGSIFQGELLISEANMLRYFPSVSGYKFLLLETPADKAKELSGLLETDLADYGMAVQTTWQRIAAYKAVENTYMGSFQTLGGLGLILGTLGLGTVLFRNVLERRGELGLMRALGFSKGSLAWVVLSENVFLLWCGLFIGTTCAVVAVLPQLTRLHDVTPLLSLAATLAGVLVVGLASGLVAVFAAMRTPLITALRSE